MIILFLFSILLSSSNSIDYELTRRVSVPKEPTPKRLVSINKDWLELRVRQQLKSLSLEEKLGQILMFSFAGKDSKDAKYWIRKFHIGAFILFSYNIHRGKNAKFLLKKMLNELRLDALRDHGLVPLIAIDQEGGKILRLRQTATPITSAMSLGATRSSSLAYLVGKLVGLELEILGINFNLAPVLDTNKNPDNKVIGVRAFSDDYALVSSMGTAYINGIQSRRVLATAKHFPGHGETVADSHYKTPVLRKTLKELMNTDWVPFIKAIKTGVSSIMVGHIAIPLLDPKSKIATLSKVLITDYLKGKLAFKGIVITDDMMMAPSSSRLVDASIKAVKAGADMLIVSGTKKDKERVYQGLLDAVRKGLVPIARINDAVYRVLREKNLRGLFLSPEGFDSLKYVASKKHYALAEKVAERSITVPKGKRFIEQSRGESFLVLSQFKSFSKFLNGYAVSNEFIRFPLSYSKNLVNKVLERIGSKTLIATLLNDWNLDIVRILKAKRPDIKIIAVSLDSPYYFSNLKPFVDSFVCLYSYRPFSLRAMAKFVSRYGKAMSLGTLPVKDLE